MDILPGFVLVLVGLAIVRWLVSPAIGRGLDQFGSGFLPYRGPGWPRGVQEEDPVAWSWSSPATPDPPAGATDLGLDGPAEIVEISRAEAPIATAPGARHVVPGLASRPR